MKRKRKFKYTKSQRRGEASATKYKILLWAALAALAILLVMGFTGKCKRADVPQGLAEFVDEEGPIDFRTPEVQFNGRFSSTFNDIQDTQIIAAERYGIHPMEGNLGIGEHLKANRLVEIDNDPRYECMAELPYLTPHASELLDEISRRFREREGYKPLRLTSCLRTHDYVSRLKKINKLAVDNSCHLYGTTFDISYGRMTYEEKVSLAQVLFELQSGGHCYVKYEKKQPCFHITSRH